jgi:dolichyl-phosphate beta-glucosyltransferase
VISVVIPAYNEERRIGASLAAIISYLDSGQEDYEIVVVDDGSRDGTAATVEQAKGAAGGRVRLLRMPENRGKGAAVRAGVLASRGAEVLLSDADLATPIEELAKLRARLSDGCDMVVGSRVLDGSDIRVRQHPARALMGRIFNIIVRTLLIGGIRDTQCGFKLFRGPAARELFAAASVDGFAFDVEILLLARSRYHVAEVPVVWRHVEQSKVSPGRDAARMLVDIVKLSWKRHGTRGRTE